MLAAAIVVPAAGCVHGRKLSEVRPSTTTTITIPVDAEAVTASTVERPTTLEGVGVRLEEVGALDDPVAIAARPGWPHLTVAERNGRLRQLSVNYRYDGDGQPAGADYRVESWTMLDIGRQVDQGDGGGVRGVTYSSDGRRMYLSYISSDGAVVVDQYRTGEGDLDTSSRFQLLRVEAPDGLRRGGALAFGRDGFLYVGVGTPDGDPGAAQRPDSLYGKVLRLDPEGALGDQAYAVPPGNPYAAGGGAGEVWLLGVHDPRGVVFDRASADLYVTDRQDAGETIVYLPRQNSQAGRGDNLGYPGAQNTAGAVVSITPPGHCDLRQGAVYRGAAIPALRGAYVFGEGCSGVVEGLVVANRVAQDQRSLGAALPPGGLGGFGTDNDGELWVFATSGQIYRVLPI